MVPPLFALFDEKIWLLSFYLLKVHLAFSSRPEQVKSKAGAFVKFNYAWMESLDLLKVSHTGFASVCVKGVWRDWFK